MIGSDPRRFDCGGTPTAASRAAPRAVRRRPDRTLRENLEGGSRVSPPLFDAVAPLPLVGVACGRVMASQVARPSWTVRPVVLCLVVLDQPSKQRPSRLRDARVIEVAEVALLRAGQRDGLRERAPANRASWEPPRGPVDTRPSMPMVPLAGQMAVSALIHSAARCMPTSADPVSIAIVPSRAWSPSSGSNRRWVLERVKADASSVVSLAFEAYGRRPPRLPGSMHTPVFLGAAPGAGSPG